MRKSLHKKPENTPIEFLMVDYGCPTMFDFPDGL